MTNAATALENRRREINSAVHTMHWVGEHADRFRADWDSKLAPIMARAASVLTTESSRLRSEAQQQMAASAAGGPSGGPGGFPPGIDPTKLASGIYDLLLATPFIGPMIMANVLVHEQGLPPDQQAAWWASLSPHDRELFLAAVPLSLLALPGLPAGDRAKANQNAADSLKGTILQSSTDTAFNAQGTIKIFSAGAAGDVTETKFADGHVEVTLTGSAFVGVGAPLPPGLSAGAQLDGQASQTYSFDNAQDAQNFENGLMNSVVPHPHLTLQSVLLGSVPGVGPVMAAGADEASQVHDYLAGYQGNVVHTQYTGELSTNVSVATPGVLGSGQQYGSINLQAGRGITYDSTTHQTTAFIEVDGNAQGNLGPFDGSAAGQVQASVTFDSSHQLQTLTISGKYQAAGGYDPNYSPFPGMSGPGGSFNVSLDCTNPQNAALAAQFVNDMQQGDVPGAVSAYHALQDQAQVVVQTDSVHTTQGGLNAVVASAGYSQTTTTANQTLVRVPGGSWTGVGGTP